MAIRDARGELNYIIQDLRSQYALKTTSDNNPYIHRLDTRYCRLVSALATGSLSLNHPKNQTRYYYNNNNNVSSDHRVAMVKSFSNFNKHSLNVRRLRGGRNLIDINIKYNYLLFSIFF